METEIWKDIPEYIGYYQISNYGNVRSFINGRHGLNDKPKKIISQSIDRYGYSWVNFRINNISKYFKVHKLVAIVFLNHIPDGHNIVVNHIDNNKLNNRLDNLELVSQRYNTSCHKTDVGVSFEKDRNKWLARIYIKPTEIKLGRFSNKQDALDMYQKALNNMHIYNGDNNAFRNALKEL